MNYQFTAGGLIVLGVVFWAASQSATGSARKVFNTFLFVLLTSMIILNWGTISPLILKKGAN